MKIKFLIYLALILLSSCSKRQSGNSQDEIKFVDKRVFDGVGLLSDLEKNKIDSLILELEKSVGSQIAIVIIDRLKDETIEEFSLRTFTEMNLGRSKFDDGVLFTQSVEDRKIRIEVGLGLEKILKDEVVARINREIVTPKFKEKKYFDGYYQAIINIKTLIEQNRDFVGVK